MEPAIKQRHRRAIKMAVEELKRENLVPYKIKDDGDIIAIDSFAHARLIKICLDEERMPKIKKPKNIPVEIWIRKRGEKEFRKVIF